jgi:GNAT superfamily N-acetyltransferase
MSEGFEIQEITDMDAAWPELEPLILGLFDYHRPWDQRVLRPDWAAGMREYMATRCSTLLARGESGAPLGFLSGTVGPEVGIFEGVVGHIDNAFVVEEARGRGIGSGLLYRFETWCREHGAVELRLEVAHGNDLGLRFWQEKGYTTSMRAMRKPLEHSG